MIGIELDNLPEVFNQLRDLGGRKAGAIQRKAITAGTRVVAKDIRSRVTVASGATKKSIGQKVKIYRGSGIGVGIAGPRSRFTKVVGVRRSGKPIFRQPSRTAHLLEKGTSRSRAHPFVGPAVAAAAGPALAAMEDKAREELEKG